MRFNSFVAYAILTSGLAGSALAQNNGFGGGKNGGNNAGNQGQNAQNGQNAGNANANANAGNANAGNANAGNANDAALTLDPQAVQTASQSAGDGGDAGQAPSLTDDQNFINFCLETGQDLTNGLQNKQGSCNGIIMGQIPPQANMVSSLIVNPAPGEDLEPDTAFDVDVQTANLVAGSFSNPDDTYYSAPQQLKNNMVVGHTHITIQQMDALDQTTALDATDFVFFKGINDAGNNQGLLSATVTKGLPEGVYRICTMAGASNHQPVLMPVAQRGAQDDCQKITVGQGNGNANAGNANANANAGNANANANQGQNAQGQNANQGQQGQAGANAGKGKGGNNRRLRFMERNFVA